MSYKDTTDTEYTVDSQPVETTITRNAAGAIQYSVTVKAATGELSFAIATTEEKKLYELYKDQLGKAKTKGEGASLP